MLPFMQQRAKPGISYWMSTIPQPRAVKTPNQMKSVNSTVQLETNCAIKKVVLLTLGGILSVILTSK